MEFLCFVPGPSGPLALPVTSTTHQSLLTLEEQALAQEPDRIMRADDKKAARYRAVKEEH